MIIDWATLQRALPRYELGEELGRGSFGLVVAVRHKTLGRLDAVKVLMAGRDDPFDADDAERFATEARTLAALDHPHVIRVYDYLEHGDLRLIVMEHLPGGTLRAWSKTHPSLDASCAVGLSVATALACAHENRVLHRDIKPDNILFAADGAPKVGDFGIAKIVEGSVASLSAPSGTPRYMAPEQFDGTQVTPSTDLYALGVLLYERLAGRTMFDPHLSASALMRHHLDVPPPPLTDVPRRLADLVMWTLEKDPARRPQAARQFAVELAEASSATLGVGWLPRSGVRTHLSDEVRGAAERSGADHAAVSAALDRHGTPTGTPTGTAGTPTGPAGEEPNRSPVGGGRRRGRQLALTVGAATLVAILAAVAIRVVTTDNSAGPATAPTASPPTTASATATAPSPGKLTAAPGPVVALRLPEATRFDILSPDGSLLVTTADELPEVGGTVVTVYDTATGTVVADLVNRSGTGLIHDVAVSPDDSTLAVATYGYLILWDLATRQPREIATAPTFGGQAFLGVTFLDDGATVAAISTDYADNHQLVLIDVTSGQVKTTRPSPDPAASVDGMTVDPDGTRLAVAMSTQVVTWDFETLTPVVVPAPTAAGTRWFTSPLGWVDTGRLTTCVTGEDDELRGQAQVDVDLVARTSSPVGTAPIASDAGAGTCGVSAAPVRLAAQPTNGSGEVVVWDPATGAELARVTTATDSPATDSPRLVRLSPRLSNDGRVLAVRDGDQIRLWTLSGGS